MVEGDASSLASRLASIGEELRVLRARLTTQTAEPRRFADIEGLWRSEPNFSYEDIRAAEYTLKEDVEWST